MRDEVSRCVCIFFQNNLSSPLHVAATYGYLDIARVLVYHGADINSRDLEQATPIHRCPLTSHTDTVQIRR